MHEPSTEAHVLRAYDHRVSYLDWIVLPLQVSEQMKPGVMVWDETYCTLLRHDLCL